MKALAINIDDNAGRSRLKTDELFNALMAAASLGYKPDQETVTSILNASKSGIRYLTDEGVASAAFALSKVHDQPYDQQWLQDFVKVATGSLPQLDAEAIGTSADCQGLDLKLGLGRQEC